MTGETIVSKVEREVDYTALDSKDFYGLLGVSRDTSTVDITKAYRRLARKYRSNEHSSPEEGIIFDKIKKAHEVLSDPEQRQRFDNTDDMDKGLVPVPRGQRRVGLGSKEEFLAWVNAGRLPLREPASKAEFLTWIAEDAVRYPDTQSIVWASRSYNNEGLWDRAVVEDNLWRLIEGGFLSYADFERDILKNQTVWEVFFNDQKLVAYFCEKVDPQRPLLGRFTENDRKKLDDDSCPWYHHASSFMYAWTAVEKHIRYYRYHSSSEVSDRFQRNSEDIKPFEYLTLASRHNPKTTGYFTEKRACLLAFLYTAMGSEEGEGIHLRPENCEYPSRIPRSRYVLDEMRSAYTKNIPPSLKTHLMMLRSERILTSLQQYDVPPESIDQPCLGLEALVEQLKDATSSAYYVPEEKDYNWDHQLYVHLVKPGHRGDYSRFPDVHLTEGYHELYVIDKHIAQPFRKKIQALEKSGDALSKKKAEQLRIVVSNIKDIVVEHMDERVNMLRVFDAATALIEEEKTREFPLERDAALMMRVRNEAEAKIRKAAERNRGRYTLTHGDMAGRVIRKSDVNYESYMQEEIRHEIKKARDRIHDPDYLPPKSMSNSQFSQELCQEVLATLKNFEKCSKIGEHRNLIGAFLKAFICGVVSVITLGTAFYYSQGVRSGFFMRTNTSALLQEQQERFIEAQEKYMPKKA